MHAFGRAVAAYTQGDFAAAVGYLRLLDRGVPVPEHLAAAHAALHATLAARARNWDRCCDWYLGSLAPRDVHTAVSAGESCATDGCGSSAEALCGQCGRGACPAHGVRDSHRVHRCVPCLNGALTNLAHAAVLAGRTEEAVRVLRSWSRDGDPSAASDLLRSLAPEDDADGPDDTRATEDAEGTAGTRAGTRAGTGADTKDVRRTVPQFLSRQHALAFALRQALGRGGLAEWERIGRLTARDGTGRVSELYRQAAARAARRLTARGEHLLAWGAWLRLWQSRPFDLDVAHGLGVAALRLLACGESLTTGVRAATTRQATACWSAVLHSPGHRKSLQEAGREEFDDGVWATAVESLRTHVTQLLQDEDRTAGHSPALSLELKWRVECEAASRWAGLRPASAPATPAPEFFCGPLYLDEVASISADWARRMREVRENIPLDGPFAALETPPETPSLAELFAPEAALATLLREGRWQEVINTVEESRPDWRTRTHAGPDAGAATGQVTGRATGRATGPGEGRPAALEILSTALVRRAQEYAKGKRWTEALRDFEQAQEAGQDVSPYADVICRAAVGAGATVRGQVKVANTQAGLLERALQLAPGHPDLIRNLTAVSLRLADQAEKAGRREEAERRYRRACELSPKDRQAADGLARVQRRSGRLLADILYADSLRNAREGSRAKALSLMRDAAACMKGLPDERFSGGYAATDVARGLWRALAPYDASDEAGVRAYVEALWLSISYQPIEEISRAPGSSGLAEALAVLAGHLLRRDAYEDVIALAERCTGAEGSLERFRTVLADAHDRRAEQRRRAGDRAGAHQDSRTARRLRISVQEKLFDLDFPEGS
ncbi:hypothetical protein ACH4SP_00995 [Streptomyces sp. NPDC021093]|uniref:hypothetical protein n=1 Tax=Streptomyces sp. NPDC021093 TaxID=3365112 RepID=UPI0037B66CA3